MYLSLLHIQPEDGKVLNTLATVIDNKIGIGIEISVRYPSKERMQHISDTIAYDLSEVGLGC